MSCLQSLADQALRPDCCWAVIPASTFSPYIIPARPGAQAKRRAGVVEFAPEDDEEAGEDCN